MSTDVLMKQNKLKHMQFRIVFLGVLPCFAHVKTPGMHIFQNQGSHELQCDLPVIQRMAYLRLQGRAQCGKPNDQPPTGPGFYLISDPFLVKIRDS